MKLKRRDEQGVTLSELLIAMVITTIIIVPIAGAMYTSLHTSASAQKRIQLSAGANLFSSYFGADVPNAVTVATNVTEDSAVCGGTARTVALLLTTQAGQSSVSYYTVPNSGTTTSTLYRRTCNVVGGSGSATPAVRIMRSVSAGPTFACAPVAGCDANWQGVTATVVQSDPVYSPAAYTTTLKASRRVS